MVCGVNQPDLERLFGNANDIAWRAGNVHLAVKADLRIGFIGLPDHQFDFTLAIDNDRPATESVGKHGHQNNGVQLRVHNRTTGRQRIGGRPCRRRDNQAIRTLAVHEMAVDEEVKANHPGGFTGMQYDIVQGRTKPQGLAVALNIAIQQEPRLLHVLAFQNLAQALLKIGRRNVSQEAQPPTVHPKQGNLGLGQLPGGAQKAAIPANHDDQITDFAQKLFAGHLQAMPWQHAGCVFFKNDVVIVGDQVLFELAQ